MRAFFAKNVPLVVLVALVIGLYSQTLNNPTFFDSAAIPEVILNAPSFSGMISEIFSWSISPGRTITAWSFSALSGLGHKSQVGLNIFLHLANSCLLFFFLKMLFRREAALIVALFFAVNPAAIYAVSYLIQRSQLLMLFFGLLQCITYLAALRSRPWLSPLFFLLSVLFYKLALISKEHSIIFLSVYPLFSLTERGLWRRSAFYCLASAFMGLALWRGLHLFRLGFDLEYYQEIVFRSCGISGDPATLYFRSILTQAWAFFKYFLHWLLPVLPTSVDMKIEFASTSDNAGLALFLAYSLGSIALLLKKRTRYLGCGLLMAALFFLPEFSRARIGEIFVLYRSYIYSLAYAVASGAIIDRLPMVRRSWATLSILGVFAALTFYRLQAFESESRLWAQAADLMDLSKPGIACQAPRAFMNAGAGLLQEARPAEAIPYLKTASYLAPEWDAPFSNLGAAYFLSGNLVQAEIVFSRLVKSSESQEIVEQAKNFLGHIASIKTRVKEEGQ